MVFKNRVMKIIFLAFFSFFGYMIQGQGNLQFNQALLVDNNIATVPAGKVWKIENIIYQAVPYFQANSGSSGSSCSPCNGSSTIWTNYTTQTCQVSTSNPIIINGIKANLGNTGSPLWLPAGTTLSGETKTCSPDLGSYSNNCICPPLSVTAKTFISIIEFNILP